MRESPWLKLGEMETDVTLLPRVGVIVTEFPSVKVKGDPVTEIVGAISFTLREREAVVEPPVLVAVIV